MSNNLGRRMARRRLKDLPKPQVDPMQNLNGGIHLLPQLAAQAQPQQHAAPVFNVGPLMNDVQLVAFLAVLSPGGADAGVAHAHNCIVAAQRMHPQLVKRLQETQSPE